MLLPALASVLGTSDASSQDWFTLHFHLGLWAVIGVTILKLVAFVGFMLIVGRRVIPWILHYVAHTGSRELFRLAVLAIALCVAFGAATLFGVSLALGAFFAGMILNESEFSHQAAKDSLPLRDAFAVLFFVSVGMLFDPSSLIREPLPILATVFIIVFGKALIALLIVLAFRYPLGIALTISASLAQIGEFSFILADLGVNLNLMPEEGRDLILGGAILSIVLNPVAFAALDWFKPRMDQTAPIESPQDLAKAQNLSRKSNVEIVPTGLTNHTILVGHGRVGSRVAEALATAKMPFIVIDDDDDVEAALQASTIEIIGANAVKQETLLLANMAAARCVILTIPNAYDAGQVIAHVKTSNPTAVVIARADANIDAQYLRSLNIYDVVEGADEVACGIMRSVLPLQTADHMERLPGV